MPTRPTAGSVLRRALIFACVGTMFWGIAMLVRGDLRRHWEIWLAAYSVGGALAGAIVEWRQIDLDPR